MSQEITVPWIGFVTNLALEVPLLQVDLRDMLLHRALAVEPLAALRALVLVLHAQVIGKNVMIEAGTG